MRQLFLVLLSSAAIALNLSNRNEKQCVQNLRDIATGLEMHSCPTGRYPLKMGAVVTSGCLKSIPNMSRRRLRHLQRQLPIHREARHFHSLLPGLPPRLNSAPVHR